MVAVDHALWEKTDSTRVDGKGLPAELYPAVFNSAGNSARLGGLFAPPMEFVERGLQGTIQRPAVGGGAN